MHAIAIWRRGSADEQEQERCHGDGKESFHWEWGMESILKICGCRWVLIRLTLQHFWLQSFLYNYYLYEIVGSTCIYISSSKHHFEPILEQHPTLLAAQWHGKFLRHMNLRPNREQIP